VLVATQSETPVPPKSDFETQPVKPAENRRESSLRSEARKPPPQASEKRRKSGPLRVNFACYLNYLIRGGAEGIRTAVLLERIPKGRNRGGFPNQVELWFILAAGLEASRDGEAFF
jgi:hypothetical protein